ncbi:MAG: DinB family protein [Planctomycetes bacterium]|nr:DinB family protein [Planctomycetota bacterium]
MSGESRLNSLQRRILSDLIRIEGDWRRLVRDLGRPFDLGPPEGGWSPAERLLHVILSLEDTADHFQRALPGDPEPPGFRERAGRLFVLTTFRLPPRLETPDAWQPGLILPAAALMARLHEAKEAFLPLLGRVGGSQPAVFRHHVSLGSMNLADWVRYLLVHSLHHSAALREPKSK